MAYCLFLLVTAAFFIRPSEVIPGVQGWPIYECLILACLVASLPRVLGQLSGKSLVENPITACVVGLLFAVVLSHLSHFNTWDARECGTMFLKPTMVDAETGVRISVERLQSTGVFSDPNDLAMILVAGVVIGLSFFTSPDSGLLRYVGLAGAGGFAYAIYLTQSRGGFLALVASLLTFFHARWGWKRTALLAAIVMPLLLVSFSGRITQVEEGIEGGTGMARVQLWSEGLQLFKQYPLFGIGCNMYAEEVGQVAHNSFVHCFTELGFLGGALFLGTFSAALISLYRLRRDETIDERPEFRALLPCIRAMLVAFAVSMCALSRCYTTTPYIVLGLVAAYTRVAGGSAGAPLLEFDLSFLKRLTCHSLGFLALTYALIRILPR